MPQEKHKKLKTLRLESPIIPRKQEFCEVFFLVHLFSLLHNDRNLKYQPCKRFFFDGIV